MKFSKFIVIPVIIATLAATLQITDQLLNTTSFFSPWKGFGWVSFQAWALYFLAGCSLKGGIKAFIGYFVGIVASILIMTLSGTFASLLGSFWATPAALLMLVIPVICLERVPWLNLVPAIFIGSGAFFGIMSYVPEVTFCKAMTVELTYCLIGLIFGFITVFLRTKYEACVSKKS